MRKQIAIALAGAACALATGAAQAGNVYWSIGISAPPIGTVISNGPVYAPAPVYVAPPPVVYEPAPVVYAPPPVVYVPRPRVVYRPVVVAPPVVYRTGYYAPGYYYHHHHHDEYGTDYRDGQWAPVPADPRRRHHDERDR